MMLLVLALTLHQSQELPTGPQLLRLLKGLHAEIQDVSFVFEGDQRLVGPEAIIGKQNRSSDHRFQGSFSYREADGAALLDTYVIRFAPGSPVARSKLSLLKGSLQQLTLIPDAGVRDASPKTSAGLPGSLSRPDSPYHFFHHWMFQELNEADASNFLVRGWEVVGGHRCLVVEGGNETRYWIDMDRGGNVLQYEDYADDELKNLRYREHDIKLAKFKAGAKEVWLPIGGVLDTFMWGSGYHSVPIYRETYAVVDGSVILDAGLGDSRFALKSKTPPPEALEKLALSNQFRDAMSKPPPAPMRTDAVGVRERIDAQLAEADRQEKMLAASAPSREWWSWASASQVLLGVAAAGALATAVVMRRRAG